MSHYTGDDDNPDTVTESDNTRTRNIDSFGGLAAVVNRAGTAGAEVRLQLANLHGDITATVPVTAADPGQMTVTEITEHGLPRVKPAAGTTMGRYGWLGVHQRDASTPGGLTLMGVRLYAPTLGRFLTIDPVEGGSANVYEYANGDPVNQFDLDGQRSWWKKAWGWAKRNKWDIALTVAGFVPGVGAAVWGYRAYRIVQLARYGSGSVRATRATAALAGRMWTRTLARSRSATNGARWVTNGSRHYRSSAKKGQGWSSNLESYQKGHHLHRNWHINHRLPKRWAPWW